MKKGPISKTIPMFIIVWIFFNSTIAFAYTSENNQELVPNIIDLGDEKTDDPLTVSANGPYFGVVGVPVLINGSVSGGISPINWTWTFGDTTAPAYQNPTSHIYHTPGVYTITVQVKDNSNTTAQNTTTATITEQEDSTPPRISILTPVTGVYFRSRLMKMISVHLTVIIGGIDIIVQATDAETGIKEVRFYIDGQLKKIVNSTPYLWTWNEKTMFSHMIKVEAEDNAGNIQVVTHPVIIFNLNPNNQCGLLTGTVLGPYGKIGAAGANITITNGSYTKTAQTGRIPLINRGDFRMRVPAGTYYIEISKPGFKVQGRNITVRLSENEQLQFILERA
ncbi:MAG: PKD domain-containing protein [Candidatus Thermoplasmatota archaeon]